LEFGGHRASGLRTRFAAASDRFSQPELFPTLDRSIICITPKDGDNSPLEIQMLIILIILILVFGFGGYRMGPGLGYYGGGGLSLILTILLILLLLRII
jgi:hypothetical protein